MQIVLRTGSTVASTKAFVFVSNISKAETTYPIESCNTGLRGHLCTYIRACSNVEMGEEYFITMRQIMLNMLRFPCVRGDVRYYVDIFWMPTMRPIIPFDMELQGNALAFIHAYNKIPELSPCFSFRHFLTNGFNSYFNNYEWIMNDLR